MKKLSGLVFVVFLLVLGSYYFIGGVTENTIKHDLNLIDQSSGINVLLADYKRGWFKSTAVINWTLTVPPAPQSKLPGTPALPAKVFLLKMPLNIYHGPIIYTAYRLKFGLGYTKAAIELPSDLIQQLNVSFTNTAKPELQLSLFINYLNKTRLNAFVPEFNMFNKVSNWNLHWLGFNSTTNISSKCKKIIGNIHFKGIDFSKDNNAINLAAIKSEYSLNLSSSGLYLGKGDIKISKFTALENNNPLFKLQGLNLASNSYVKNNLLYSNLNMDLNLIDLNQQSYGPGHLEIDMRKLDEQVIANIKQQVKNTTGAQQKFLLQLLPEIPKLLDKGAEFELKNTSFTMPIGTIEANALIVFPNEPNLSALDLMQKMTGTGHLKVPMQLVKSIMIDSIKSKLLATASNVNVNPQADTTTIVISNGKTEKSANPVVDTNTTVTNDKTIPNDKTNTTVIGENNVSKVTAPANVNVDVQADNLAENQLNTLQEKGILKIEGTYYVIDVNFENGQLLINGKLFNSDMLKF